MIFGPAVPAPRLAIGKRQSARAAVGEPPAPPRLGFRIKSGPGGDGGSGAGGGGGGAPPTSWSCGHSSGRQHPPPSLAARGKGFPRGPCAAASCRSFCWRSSSAKRRGGRPPRCRRPERSRWPRCTRVATTGRWVSVRRAPVLGGTSQSQGAGLSAFLGPGYGGWLCSDLSTQTSPFSQNSTPPFPILESCQRLGSCGLVPWSFPALFTLPQCIRAGAQLSKTPDPKQRRSPSLRTYPTPPLIRHCSVGEQRWEAGSPSASIQPGIRDSDLRELGLRLCVGQSHRWGTRDRRACSGFQICSVSSA